MAQNVVQCQQGYGPERGPVPAVVVAGNTRMLLTNIVYCMATNDSSTETGADSRDGVDAEPIPELTEKELAALHEVELGLEWLQRAQGCLIEFHHATGHGMDHLAEAEILLRKHGHEALADAIRDELLPHGVVDDDRWSYDVLENFQETLLAETKQLERRVRTDLADGERHVSERQQEREWKERAGRR